MVSGQIIQNFDMRASRALRLLLAVDSAEHGVSKPDATRRLAQRIGVAPGTLENIARERSKGVRAWVWGKLNAALLAEIERIQAELVLAVEGGVPADAPQVDAASTLVSQAAEYVKREKVK